MHLGPHSSCRSHVTPRSRTETITYNVSADVHSELFIIYKLKLFATLFLIFLFFFFESASKTHFSVIRHDLRKDQKINVTAENSLLFPINIYKKVFQILAEPFSAYRVKIISNRESPGRSYSYAGYYF